MKLAQLGDELGLAVHGNEQHDVSALASIESAGPQDLSFVVSKRYLDALKASRAGAVIVSEALLSAAPGNALVSPNPHASFAAATWLIRPPAPSPAGVHHSACIHPEATVASTASIGPCCVIGKGCSVGDEVVMRAHCTLAERVSIGARSYLFDRVNLGDDVSIGSDCRIQSGAVIGSEGFGFARQGDRWVSIRQVGGVLIGDRVHIGANTTIDCGAIEPTVIENDVILDNQIQIAHNVRIGHHTAIAGCTGVAGSAQIGSGCQIGGACNIVGHLTIADGVIINGASLVSRSIDTVGRYGSGMPLQEEHAWRRSFVNLCRLEGLFKRVRKLERRSETD